MNDKTMFWLFALVVWALGCFSGYAFGHLVVSRECERLGGFYVGNATFECKQKR